MNRLLHPVLHLQTEEEVVAFMEQSDTIFPGEYETKFFKKSKDQIPSISDQYALMRVKTRVLVFFYNVDEYKPELKQLKNAARYLAARANLRVAYCDNKFLIKKMKQRYAALWFTKVALSSAVIKRYDGRYENFDITSGDTINFGQWISKNSLKQVEELTPETNLIIEQLRQPVFIAFVDFNDPTKL